MQVSQSLPRILKGESGHLIVCDSPSISAEKFCKAFLSIASSCIRSSFRGIVSLFQHCCFVEYCNSVAKHLQDYPAPTKSGIPQFFCQPHLSKSSCWNDSHEWLFFVLVVALVPLEFPVFDKPSGHFVEQHLHYPSHQHTATKCQLVSGRSVRCLQRLRFS